MYGFRSANGVIQNVGHAPITVRDVDAQVTIRNGAPPLKAMALDEQGYFRRDLETQITDGTTTVMLPKDSLYTILTR